MNKYFLYFMALFIGVVLNNTFASKCGCKILRPCYQDMIDALLDRDEEACVEDASTGVSTILIYLRALKQFCPEVIQVDDESLTHEGRYLYEVVLTNAQDQKGKEKKPTIMIDAGQDAGTESVEMAMFVMEQLIACQENNEMLNKVKWVILPSTNPDGLEFSRYNRVMWKKNVKPSSDGLSFGVDITRNFDYQWGSCEKVESAFSPNYPGPSSGSENETIFIKNSLYRHKQDLKLYLSLRRNGHSILYPYAYQESSVPNNAHITKVAADVAAKVNQRAGGVQMFLNYSIYEANGKPHCGHSVDTAYDMGIPLSYEMRLFLADDFRIMSMFQQMPRGYESSLRLGYLSGIRELYNAVVNDNKHSKTYK